MAVLATDNGSLTGNPINDCYGSITQAAGTAIVRVLPPRLGLRTCLGNFRYVTGTTAHIFTPMVVLDTVGVGSTDVAVGATTVTLTRNPTAPDGTIIAAGDYVVMQYADGSWNSFLISGLSGLVITIPATTQLIRANSAVFYFGAPADHASRNWTMPASTTYDFSAGDFRIRGATSAMNNQPILIVVNNITNAGTLHHTAYYFD